MRKENSPVSDHDASLLAYDMPATSREHKGKIYFKRISLTKRGNPIPEKMKINIVAVTPEAVRDPTESRKKKIAYEGKKCCRCMQNIFKKKTLSVSDRI